MACSTSSPDRYSIPLLLILIAAGLAGNHFKFPIFLNIDFLFGSIFAMLALQFLGLGRGIIAAAAIAGYTYVLWNHPYAIVIMTAEVAFVGLLMGRRKMGMVLADTLYWLIIGMPLVYLFYHVVMHVHFSTAYITMAKQAVNGIANTLVARLIFTAYTLKSRSSRSSFSEIIYNLLTFFVLCPALIMLAIESRTDFAETDRTIRTSLTLDSQRIDHFFDTWAFNREAPILNLASMAASRSPQQMQPYLEVAKLSDVNFLRVGLLDREAIVTAYFPLVDELGQENIGKNYADRPFIPQLRRTLKPMLSEVVMARVGPPKPMVAMLAPVVIRGEYGGYVAGILSLDQVKRYMEKSVDGHASFYTLIDKNGNIIMTNRTDQTVMKPFVRSNGMLNRLEAGISQWIPFLPKNTPAAEQWKKSFYVAESSIGNLAEWKLILEQPVAPFQKALYDNYTGKLTLLFLILLGSLALAELLSRQSIVTLEKLRQITRDLPTRLAKENTVIDWPESSIDEATHLIDNFKQMSGSLTELFHEVKKVNESLEQRVVERTQELKEANDSLNDINLLFKQFIHHSPFYAFIKEVTSTESRVLYASENYQQMIGIPGSEMVGKSMAELFPATMAAKITSDDISVVSSGQVLKLEEELDCRCYTSIKFPIKQREKTLLAGFTIDITDRKKSEEEVKYLNEDLENRVRERTAELERMNFELEGFCYAISHEFRAPIARLEGFGSVLLEIAGQNADDQTKHCAERIVAAGARLRTVIDSLLTMNRLSRADLLLSPVNLSEISMQVVAELRENIGNRVLETRIAPDIVVQGDRYLLEICMRNLLGNAVKYTSNTLEASIEFGQFCSEATPIYYVRDNGVGFDMECAKNLFVPFCRLHTQSEFEGTGIGLATVYRIIEKHSGRIWAESEPGHGATFFFTLREKDVRFTDE